MDATLGKGLAELAGKARFALLFYSSFDSLTDQLLQYLCVCVFFSVSVSVLVCCTVSVFMFVCFLAVCVGVCICVP